MSLRRIIPQSLDFERFVACLFLMTVMLAACLMPAQSDTWWHLRTGEEMWRSGQVMLRDDFTHSVTGVYWPNHEWLSQLLFYSAYAVGGLPLLTAICATAVALAWLAVERLTPGPWVSRIVLLGAGATITSPSWSLRPQVFSIALLGVTVWIVVRRRWLWTLPPVFLLWANLHGGVSYGIIVLAASVIAALLVRRDQFPRLLLVAVICCLCTIVTPLGASLWREIPSSLQRLHLYGVLEWQPPTFSLSDAPFWCAAALSVVLFVINRSRLPRQSWEFAVLAATATLFFATATQTRRNVPPFIFCTVPLLGVLTAASKEGRTPRRRTQRPDLNALVLATAATAGVVVVAAAWRAPAARLGWKPVSPALRSAILACPERLYNRYDDGGYLIWFVPEKKVFMDSRQDPFPIELVQRHIALERSGDYQELFNQYQVHCALTAKESALARHLASDGWTSTSGDGSWIVFRDVRNSAERVLTP